MKLIILGFTDDIFVKIVYRLLDQLPVEFVEYYHDKPNRIAELVNAHGQHYLDIQAGNYDCDWNEIEPLDEELIEAMSACEQTVMRMFDRNAIWVPLSYDQRKALYLAHLRYWNHVIVTRKIDAALFSGVPHGLFDYVVYALCKLKNVPALLFSCPSLLTDVMFISDNWEDPAPELGIRYRQLLAEGKLPGADSLTLQPRFERHYLAQARTDEEPPTPYHMSQAWLDANKPPTAFSLLKQRISGWFNQPAVLAAKIVNPGFWKRKLFGVASQRARELQAKEIAEYYDAHVTQPDLECRFIYLPLQQQPELTTSPMAGAYVDQILIAEMLAAVLPDDVVIYVKEHPGQIDCGLVSRSLDYYQRLERIRNVRFISLKFSTHRLIDNCLAVATATGTAGWEALFRGRPFLMFGHHIYQYAPGVFPIRTTKDCRVAAAAILAGAKPTLAEMRLFLKAMEDVAVIGFTDAVRRQITETSDEANVNTLADAMIERIRKLGIA